MIDLLSISIGAPILLGIICFLLPQNIKWIREVISLIVSAGILIMSGILFTRMPMEWYMGETLVFRLDTLSGFVLLASGLFAFLITLYSIKFMKENKNQRMYYGSLLMTMGAAVGVFLANHLIVLLLFWGFFGHYPIPSCPDRRTWFCPGCQKVSGDYRRQ